MISIIFPILFYHENIYNAIKSIYTQNYKFWELLIGFNMNTEDSLKIVNELNKFNKEEYNVKIIEFKPKTCKIEIMNSLKNMCKYEWISIKNIDDIWLNDKLSQQMFIASGNEYSIIGTNYMLDDHYKSKGKNIPLREINNYNFLYHNPMINSSVIIKKELCNWTKNWLHNDEYELFIILWLNKYKFYNLSYPYIIVIIDCYLKENTLNKNYYKSHMIHYYEKLINDQLEGSKSFVFISSFTNHLSGEQTILS